jgi:hypothetical protein
MVIAAEGDLAIRAMRDNPEDYRLLMRWRAEPHVHEWWDPDDPAPTYAEVVEQYGPTVHGEDKTTACIIEVDGRPVGFLQFYRWLPYLEADPSIDIAADADTFGVTSTSVSPTCSTRASALVRSTSCAATWRTTSARRGSRSRPRSRTTARSAPTRRLDS